MKNKYTITVDFIGNYKTEAAIVGLKYSQLRISKIKNKDFRVYFHFYHALIKFFGIRTLLFLSLLEMYFSNVETDDIEDSLIKYHYKELNMKLTVTQKHAFKVI